jgi:nucleoside-diphosphate-sugar epimerase
MNDFLADFKYWHFVLPNMFSYIDKKEGTRLIPYVVKYLKDYRNGLSPAPPSFSAGTQTRQYILVEEIKQVIERAYEKRIPSGIYNIGGGEFMSIRETIEKLFSAYGVPCLDSYFGKVVKRDGDVRSLCLDGQKLFDLIGYLPYKRMTDILLVE